MIPVATAAQTQGGSTKSAASPASPSNQRAVLVAAVVLVLVGLVLLTDVAAVVPWQSLLVGSKLRGSPSFAQGQGNHSSSPATYGQAQALQQAHQQQQQEHQQQQQQLLQIKQQHEQQAQALLTVQQVQHQVHAGLQKLEQLYEQLINSSALAASRYAAAQPLSSGIPGNATEQGVVCTVLRNEAKYIPEWVAFHLVMGATKIVIYDDNSTDGIKEATAPFGDRVVVVDLKSTQGVPGDAAVHRVAGKQDWSFNHCKATYAPANGTGWLGIWDVDEFVFPCMRPSPQSQGKNFIWEAYNASTKPGADGHALHCSIFGQNHNDTPQGTDTLVLVNNIRRSADSRSEPAAAPKAWEAVADGCNKCGCCQVTSRKTIYNIKTVGKWGLSTHGPHGNALIDNSWQKPLAGLCCNHYQFKSTNESFEKAGANLNGHYNNVANTSDAKKHLTMLQDTLVWQYLADMVQLLQQKGFLYKLPEVPMLVGRD